jgi:uncharacterized SAM-binding protein YcdF (DUF218 family)
MKEQGISLESKIVFVSSDFHSVRVGIIADEHGLNSRSIGVSSSDSDFILPSLVRELMSYARYYLFYR